MRGIVRLASFYPEKSTENRNLGEYANTWIRLGYRSGHLEIFQSNVSHCTAVLSRTLMIT